MDFLASLSEMMRRRGVHCSPLEFQSAVNLVFHRFESEVYDQEHRDMWESLPQQFALLAADCLQDWPEAPATLRLLDVGCGTGLATDSLLKSCVGPRIAHVGLLDTSAAMLAHARQRASTWKVPFACHEGLIGGMAGKHEYDLIVVCSVLHHVPDLEDFARHVRCLQHSGGYFLHIQDPNGDYLRDPELKRRMEEARRSAQPEWTSLPKRALRRARRAVTGPSAEEYVLKANRELLRTGVIESPMTAPELYSVVDIRVENGEGISVEQMAALLPDYRLISQRSYGFFGELWWKLPAPLRKAEEELIARKAQNGFHVGAAWKLSGV